MRDDVSPHFTPRLLHSVKLLIRLIYLTSHPYLVASDNALLIPLISIPSFGVMWFDVCALFTAKAKTARGNASEARTPSATAW